MRPTCSFYIMPLHPSQFHHLALGNRKGRGERFSSLQRAVPDIMGENWHVRMRRGVTNVVDVYTDVPTDHQLDLQLNAVAALWESRKDGQSVRRLQYSRLTSTWYCSWEKIVSVRKTLGAPHSIDFVLHTPGGGDLIGSRVNLKEKVHLMWQHNPLVTQGNQVLVGISIDGTKLWQRSFEHFAVGELGSHLRLGSWVLLQGSETTQILCDLAHQENLKLDVLVVNEMQVLKEGGFATPAVCVIIADIKAQIALSGCRKFTCKDPLAHVCSLCGGDNLHCLGAFGQGISILLEVWHWGGMTLPAVLPFKRPPDFGLHGVHRLVHFAGSGLAEVLMHHHGWTKGRALVWVQWFSDDIRLESRTATATYCEQEKVGKEALRLEQAAAGAWVKRQGRDCIADYLQGDNLLQVPVQVGAVAMTWTACWRLWGEKFALTFDLVWKEGRLDLRDLNMLTGALSEMGSAHRACGFVLTLWVHLWVDHMWGIAREWATLSPFSAFRGRGRHQSLKCEIRKRSFKEGSKKRGYHLRGAH